MLDDCMNMFIGVSHGYPTPSNTTPAELQNV